MKKLLLTTLAALSFLLSVAANTPHKQLLVFRNSGEVSSLTAYAQSSLKKTTLLAVVKFLPLMEIAVILSLSPRLIVSLLEAEIKSKLSQTSEFSRMI